MVRLVAVAAAGLVLGGCTAAGNFCDVARPLTFSTRAIDAMSRDEVDAALSHNRKGQALCGWRPGRS